MAFCQDVYKRQAKVYYLCKHFGGSPEGKCTAVDAPAGAITCRDHHAFVSAYYGNGFRCV